MAANSLKMHAIGIDISAFNCLLTDVKTKKYDLLQLKHELNDAIAKTEGLFTDQLSFFGHCSVPLKTDNEYMNTWYSDRAVKELLGYKFVIMQGNYKYKDVMKIILSRAARSARQAPHYELDWPKEPVKEPYYCYKHKKICYPTDEALKFLRRYTFDTFRRLKEYSKIRTDYKVMVKHGDSRTININRPIDGIFTSPPYCGLIDYHQQHEYAYNLLGLQDLSHKEIGAKEQGQSKKAIEDYKQGIIEVFSNCNRFLNQDGKLIIIVNDKFDIYQDIINKSNFEVVQIVNRQVNRRTGRRSTDFTEDIIICRKA